MNTALKAAIQAFTSSPLPPDGSFEKAMANAIEAYGQTEPTCHDCEALRTYLIEERDADDYWLEANGSAQRAIEIMKDAEANMERLGTEAGENEARKSIIVQLQATIEDLKSENAAKAAVIHRLMPV